jgi:hypothetical protein
LCTSLSAFRFAKFVQGQTNVSVIGFLETKTGSLKNPQRALGCDNLSIPIDSEYLN